ncbi:XkdX family protein [Clostridium sp.]|nr:XkdX family protein [Clostridium sp.]MDR3595083.1 XkdX family protein [Clostridium sp.]
MYEFIKNQWILGKYTAANIANCVTKGYITQDQANTITAIDQVTTS